MVTFPSEPTMCSTDHQVIVNLRVADNTADAAWRAVFNERAQGSPINTEAMGSKWGEDERTVIVARLDTETSYQDVTTALDTVREIAKHADGGEWDRRNADAQVGRA